MNHTAHPLPTLEFAQHLDAQDPLAQFRKEFYLPALHGSEPTIYLTGNSLGLQPKKAKQYVLEEFEDWEQLGVEGHFEARHPWLPYHEFLTEPLAQIVGAHPSEVVTMNTLSVNLHLMMVSFYRPNSKRYKILIEKGAFPSDQYAVASQARFHGYPPEDAIVELTPREGEATLRSEDIFKTIEQIGSEVALILIGNVNYLTGQAFPMKEITRLGHKMGCFVGFDLAHGAGNLRLNLHDTGPDFAVWCSYKYLNGGPGALGGCFVHERHSKKKELPRFSGWWGHNKTTRFQMGPEFDPIPGAEGWQLSNPPILQLAALRAAFEIFNQAGMDKIELKRQTITSYFDFLLENMLGHEVSVLTPKDQNSRGTQLSLVVKGASKDLVTQLRKNKVIVDFREPNVIRVAPAPLYVSYSDVYRFVQILSQILKKTLNP